jgi:phosphate-selective porin OprO/OprP
MGEYSNGEYSAESYQNNTSYDTKTYYLETGYFITGEKYADSYKGGVFGSFKPKNNFDLDNNQWGAVELAFRIEGFNVDDVLLTAHNGSTLTSRIQGSISTNASGGKSGATTYTAGLRWILNPNVVFKVNYAYTKMDYLFQPIDVLQSTALNNINSESLLMTRLQYMF